MKAVHSHIQECTNFRHLVTWETKFCTVTPNICGSSVWNLLHVTILATRWLLDFLGKFFHPCSYECENSNGHMFLVTAEENVHLIHSKEIKKQKDYFIIGLWTTELFIVNQGCDRGLTATDGTGWIPVADTNFTERAIRTTKQQHALGQDTFMAQQYLHCL